MNNFKYNITTQVYFGDNGLDKLGQAVSEHSKRILLTYGSDRIKSNGLYNKVVEQLKAHDIFFVEVSGIKPNPSIQSVREGVQAIQEHDLGFILAVGGGSVIDCSKGMAASVATGVDAWDFCKRKAAVKDALPIGTVLTLAATGSEMNGNSVISNEETGEKLAFGHDLCRPQFSVLDPTLTFSVPTNQTAAGIVDIFTHTAEQYFEPTNDAYVVDRMSEGIFDTCIRYGRTVIEEPENYEARANILWAGSVGLNGLLSYGKSGGDWASHGIEHEVSAVYDITHGLGLGIILPKWMKYVLNDETVDRFAMFASKVWGLVGEDKFELANAGIKATQDFFISLDMPMTFSEIGIDTSKFKHMSEQATQFGPIGSFKSLEADDVEKILILCK